jgi:Ni/Co efflux regulator RcnB
MKLVLSILAGAAMALSATALAQADKHGEQERKEDAKRHRALATVHEAAARCLEAGKTEKVCLDQLRKDCKGLGIGKYCGMKHAH